MTFKGVMKRLTTPVHELDKERLRAFACGIAEAVDIAEAQPRQEVTVAGQIKYVRIVPRPDGSPWLEATVDDGTGSLSVMWTGRKKIAGIRPGQHVVITGRGAPTGPGGRLLIYNPRYELR
jgi:DNA polymerase III alpha subunit